jgi:transketolase
MRSGLACSFEQIVRRPLLGLKNRPAALICSRQALPIVDRSQFAPASRLARGAYILVNALGSVPDVILIGSGSEVSLCVAARDLLASENISARVVSMPSWELFDAQEPAYQQSVLPPAVTARVTVEEASPIGWERYAGPCGVVLGMHSFGMSAPMKIVAEHFGFKAEHVVDAAKSSMRHAAGGTSSQDDQFRS